MYLILYKITKSINFEITIQISNWHKYYLESLKYLLDTNIEIFKPFALKKNNNLVMYFFSFNEEKYINIILILIRYLGIKLTYKGDISFIFLGIFMKICSI